MANGINPAFLLLATRNRKKKKDMIPDEAREAVGEVVKDLTGVYTSTKQLAEVGQNLVLQAVVARGLFTALRSVATSAGLNPLSFISPGTPGGPGGGGSGGSGGGAGGSGSGSGGSGGGAGGSGSGSGGSGGGSSGPAVVAQQAPAGTKGS